MNYVRVAGFKQDHAGKLTAAVVDDFFSGRRFLVRARKFVNATGPMADGIRRLASPALTARLRPSKGVHIFLPLDGFPVSDALLVPRTEDGRVVFAIPWNGRLMVGTTDTGYTPGEEMIVTRAEIEYLLRQLNPYFERPFTPDHVVSGIAGIRPLVSSGKSVETKNLSRDDEVEIDSSSGLISILGGKWTTYRLMAEETIDAVQRSLGMAATPAPTRDYPLVGAEVYSAEYWLELAEKYDLAPSTAQHLANKYGTAAEAVLQLIRESPELELPLVEGLAPLQAQVVYAVREEMAHTLEDVLARRIGLQFYSWKVALESAPLVARLMARERGWSTAQRESAVAEYSAKINRYLEAAGLAVEGLHLHSIERN